MPPNTTAGSDFASILNAAMQLPGGEKGTDLPDGFPFPDVGAAYRTVATTEEGVPGTIQWNYKTHRDVFVTFRMWEHCARCGTDLAAGNVELPAVGDYNCPHTQKEAYEATVNRTMASEKGEMFGSEQEYPQKDGTILMSVRWFERIPRPKKITKVGVDGTAPEPPF